MSIKPENINSLNYPDFIAFISQPNTPPGGNKTIKKWINFSHINQYSVILDLACSTGFASRSITELTGCQSRGIDISSYSIEIANELAQKPGLADKLSYSVNDAVSLPFNDNAFSHVIAGCNFAFIQQRKEALGEAGRVLEPEGKLCVANFYYVKSPPEDLMQRVAEHIDFRPDPKWTLDWWRDFFSGAFELREQELLHLPKADEDEVYAQVKNFIYEQSSNLKNASNKIKHACFQRLFNTRLILNEHRNYQSVEISTWVNK